MNTHEICKGLLALTSAVLATTGSGKTCTWAGGASGAWSEPANWSDSAVPAGGDIALFGSAVTLEDETVDVGDQGLTILNSAKVTGGIVFTGAGKIVKQGAGQYETKHPWKTTGGLRLEGGSVYVNQLTGSEMNGSDPFGTGPIEITGSAFLSHASWGRVFNSPLVISTFTGASALDFGSSGPVTFKGSLSSDSNFGITVGWSSADGQQAKFYGDFSAPGKTVTFGGSGRADFFGQMNASLNKNNSAVFLFSGQALNAENALTVSKGEFKLASGAIWKGTNILVSATGTLTVSGCLTPLAEIRVEAGGKIDAACGRLRVKRLTVGGEARPNGTYTSETLPGVVTAGEVVVDDTETVLVWIGGTTGKWSEKANWSLGRVPQGGDTVEFNTATTLAEETVDLGDKDLTIGTVANVTGKIAFTGSGKIVKCGKGQYASEKSWKTTGGLRLEDGTLTVNQCDGNAPDPFGTGKIEITGKACLANTSWAREFTSSIVISAFTGKDAISFPNGGVIKFTGPLTADSDFGVTVGWPTTEDWRSRFSGGLSAPGRTVTFGGDGYAEVSGAVDASLDKNNKTNLTFSGTAINAANTLTVSRGRFILAPQGVWLGTNILVSATGTLTVSGCLTPLAEIRVEAGGKIDAACGRLRVKRLTVGGEARPNGTYTSETLPGVVTAGEVVVDDTETVLAWVGGTTGKWSEKANWSLGRVPQGGDTVLFGSAVTLEDETVDVGDKGLTILNIAKVTGGIVFTGGGKIVKQGAGQYETTHPWKTTGGLRLEGGSVFVAQLGQNGDSEHNAPDPFGTGPIEITGSACLQHTSYGREFKTPFVIRNFASSQSALSFEDSGPVTFSGPFSSDSDFCLTTGWSRSRFSGGLSAPGKTASFLVPWNGTAILSGVVDASIVKAGASNSTLVFSGTQTNAGNSFSVLSGTGQFEAGAIWQGGTVSVASGCTLDIAKGVRVRATKFIVGGKEQPEGRYTAENRPDVITGGGSLRVGTSGLSVIVR